jgi:hypothetical protein
MSVTISEISNCDKEDWYVRDSGAIPINGAVYDHKYTSDNVRTAYARLKGIKIQNVRACRIKNF